MLSDELKTEIQTAYTNLLNAKGFKARNCQKQMVAEIANTLGNIEVDDEGHRVSENNICVIEAGTGTGKTIAYALAVLPVARAAGKKVVISTATVALQEQIVFTDMPDILEHAALNFSFALAKGRRRYLCLSRLDLALQEVQSDNQNLALFDDEIYTVEASNRILYEQMLTKLGQGSWDGDRDNWPLEIENSAWFPVSTDHVQCNGRKCSHYENCYFYRAREKIHRVDCIVTNHDLVLSDLVMGGGAVLPAPEDTIYVFDEGHHLPDKAINHLSNFLQIRSSQSWLEQLPNHLKQLSDELGEIGGLPAGLVQFDHAIRDLIERLEDAIRVFEPLRTLAEGSADDLRYRFTGGQIGAEHRSISEMLYQVSAGLHTRLIALHDALDERLDLADGQGKNAPEHWLPLVAAMAARVAGAMALWQEYSVQDSSTEPPRARWVNFREADELMLQVSPIAVHDRLRDMLWSRCFGAVITSATLAMSADFTRFQQRMGLSPDGVFRCLQSPFKFPEQATLSIPLMDVDPRTADDHNEAVAGMLPDLLSGVKGGLVLFASWRQMYRIRDGLYGEFMDRVLIQGDFTKAEIVSRHKKQVDSGNQSIIFGLASFAEGIDLPGPYCDHVVVVKIPFSVPDDPVGATLNEWIENNGGNAFREIMIPDAALRLVQACGRLLRTETDSGTVTILDRRLVSQWYGAKLLNALPPFRREIA